MWLSREQATTVSKEIYDLARRRHARHRELMRQLCQVAKPRRPQTWCKVHPCWVTTAGNSATHEEVQQAKHPAGQRSRDTPTTGGKQSQHCHIASKQRLLIRTNVGHGRLWSKLHGGISAKLPGQTLQTCDNPCLVARTSTWRKHWKVGRWATLEATTDCQDIWNLRTSSPNAQARKEKGPMASSMFPQGKTLNPAWWRRWHKISEIELYVGSSLLSGPTWSLKWQMMAAKASCITDGLKDGIGLRIKCMPSRQHCKSGLAPGFCCPRDCMTAVRRASNLFFPTTAADTACKLEATQPWRWAGPSACTQEQLTPTLSKNRQGHWCDQPTCNSRAGACKPHVHPNLWCIDNCETLGSQGRASTAVGRPCEAFLGIKRDLEHVRKLVNCITGFGHSFGWLQQHSPVIDIWDGFESHVNRTDPNMEEVGKYNHSQAGECTTLRKSIARPDPLRKWTLVSQSDAGNLKAPRQARSVPWSTPKSLAVVSAGTSADHWKLSLYLQWIRKQVGLLDAQPQQFQAHGARPLRLGLQKYCQRGKGQQAGSHVWANVSPRWKTKPDTENWKLL